MTAESMPQPSLTSQSPGADTQQIPCDEPPRNGRILTFYSYKGGTGRTMLLANLGWLLAAAGQRVLMIDWDFEAPGLHRYYRVFLDDPDLTETHGLLDFLQEFVDGSRLQLLESKKARIEPAPNWFEEFARLSRFSIPIDHEFPGEGSLELIGAGRQGPAYSQSVNSFHWDDFYSKSGGGVFLERVKELLRQEYDYILIDSRTGLSDTAGICTIQMPDDLVLCLTLNRQNIEGAEAVGRSASQARRKPSGAPGLRVWPVAMRVELAEKDRLEKARNLCRERLTPLAWQLNRKERAEYWRDMEILYYPYYAYEEVLAPIADTPGSRSTLLDNVVTVGRRLVTDIEIGETGIRRQVRETLLTESLHISEKIEFSITATQHTEVVVLSEAFSTSPSQFEIAAAICEHLKHAFGDILQLKHETVPKLPNSNAGIQTPQQIDWLRSSRITILVLPNQVSDAMSICIQQLLNSHNAVIACSFIPTLRELRDNGPSAFDSLKLNGLTNWDFVSLEHGSIGPAKATVDLRPIFRALTKLLNSQVPATSLGDDPQKGRWGSLSKADQFHLDATIHRPNAAEQWFQVSLIVSAFSKGNLLDGPVEFHLHPGCVPSPQVIEPETPHQASLKFNTHRAFTVGVSLRGGEVCLELDLRTVPGAPQAFVES